MSQWKTVLHELVSTIFRGTLPKRDHLGRITKVGTRRDVGGFFLISGDSVCNRCGSDMPGCWDVVCDKCRRTFCYRCAQIIGDNWVCKLCEDKP
jgi:hypothetical protein